MKKQSKSSTAKVSHKKASDSKQETQPTHQLVCLLGDENLVKEYSSAFQSAGVAVIELKNLTSLKTSAKKITLAFELSLELSETKSKNLSALDETLSPAVPIVSSSITSTVLAQAQIVKHPERLFGIAAFPTLIEHSLVELAPSLYTSQGTADAVTAFFSSIKKDHATIEDTVGMVMPRILCQIINEALFTVQNDVANPKDVDIAMKLGAHYPYGPIEWGEKIGFKNIVTVLDALHHHTGEERYRVAPLLRQLAIAGTFWNTKE